MITRDRILDLLRRHPGGLLAEEVSVLLQVPKTSLSGRLSKLVAYGIIRSERVGKPIRADGKTPTATVQRYLPPLIQTNQTAAAVEFALIALKTAPLIRRKYGWGGGQRSISGQTVKLLIDRGLARMEGEQLVGITLP